jgi:4'-phosphopantetheinyl transferase
MWDVLPSVPRGYAIPDDEVHVWLTRVGWSSRHIGALADVLSLDERQKAERFRFQVDRERHVIGRGFLRGVLGRILDTGPDGLCFHYNDFGKPRLPDAQNELRLQFSVSHSGDLILIGLAANRQIGVDVERVRDGLEPEAIAGRFFSSGEQADLATLPPDQRRDAFFCCWCRKEAFIKARGEGLSLPLNRFDVSLKPGEPAMLLATRPDAVEASRWVIRDLDVGPGHKAAVAVEGSECRLRTLEWRPGQ